MHWKGELREGEDGVNTPHWISERFYQAYRFPVNNLYDFIMAQRPLSPHLERLREYHRSLNEGTGFFVWLAQVRQIYRANPHYYNDRLGRMLGDYERSVSGHGDDPGPTGPPGVSTAEFDPPPATLTPEAQYQRTMDRLRTYYNSVEEPEAPFNEWVDHVRTTTQDSPGSVPLNLQQLIHELDRMNTPPVLNELGLVLDELRRYRAHLIDSGRHPVRIPDFEQWLTETREYHRQYPGHYIPELANMLDRMEAAERANAGGGYVMGPTHLTWETFGDYPINTDTIPQVTGNWATETQQTNHGRSLWVMIHEANRIALQNYFREHPATQQGLEFGNWLERMLRGDFLASAELAPLLSNYRRSTENLARVTPNENPMMRCFQCEARMPLTQTTWRSPNNDGRLEPHCPNCPAPATNPVSIPTTRYGKCDKCGKGPKKCSTLGSAMVCDDCPI